MRSLVIVGVLVIVAVVVLTQSLYVVDETKQVIVLQFGEFQETVTKPGLHVKVPFVQSIKSLEARVLMSDAPPTGYLTMDKKNLIIDHITRWSIEEPDVFYKTVRNESGALQRLQDVVVSELRTEVASHDFEDMISSQREPIMEIVAERANEKVSEFGMGVIDVRIKRADLSKEVEASVFDRMKAERERISKQNRAEGEEQAFKTRAEADREAVVILAESFKTSQELRGQGDAQATAIYAAAYAQAPEFYSLLRTLEAYSNFLNQDTTMVLSTESDLLKYLSGSEPQE
ncbi:MAG: protease modulator HflC [Chloroflexi bacterium]|nr:protease modulator HflC [Chloroflexota bacterium]